MTTASKQDFDLLQYSALQGNTALLTKYLDLFQLNCDQLLLLYKISFTRGKKLQPNDSIRIDLQDKLYNVKQKFNALKSPNDQTLIEQGIKCIQYADIIYKRLINYFITSDVIATQFAYILCQIDYQSLYDFNLLYNVNIDYQYRGLKGRTFLHIAARRGNLQMIKFLMKQKVNLDVQDYYNRTALHYATMNHHDDVIKTLLKHKCRVDIEDHDGYIALHYVAPGRCGHQDIFNLLLQYGSNINKKFKDRTMLYYAVYDNQWDLVDFLLKKGASPFVTSLSLLKSSDTVGLFGHIQFKKYYETPLHLALKLQYNNLDSEIENIKIIMTLTKAMN
ncbi:MAG TPA: ankyrin repeat domain-containing protein [Candidatus Saccharimonadales bacterium]|nr:ankyrin repeat domain-containing protein [Candidatus Saccharimonadales bacterium]